jgi:Arc/MetJ-type ribon-helix-helix transcriptional regulator
MKVTVPAPLEEFAKLKVAAGEFDSLDDVVCEGLRLLQLREKWKNDARGKIDVGWEQIKRGELLSSEQARENLASRKQQWRGKAPNCGS